MACIFNEKIHQGHLERLISNSIGTVETVAKSDGIKGIYAFFEGKDCLYVGRTNRKSLRGRMRQHLSPYDNRAVLAFKLAKEELGIQTQYRGPNTRKNLMQSPNFIAVFLRQIERVAKMQVRFVEISDSDEQYLFEFYAAKALNSSNNTFGTH